MKPLPFFVSPFLITRLHSRPQPLYKPSPIANQEAPNYPYHHLSMDSSPPCVSFIGIVDFSEEARWIHMTDSVSDLLGFEPHELVGRPSLELVHPDEFPRVKKLHYDTIQDDKAAVLAYLRMRHKDPYKGYILCGISRLAHLPLIWLASSETKSFLLRTVVHNVLVGSVSFASPGAKAMYNASTAQEITVITPSAANFEFRRWNDPSPMPPSPVPRTLSLPECSSSPPSSSSWSSPSPRSSEERSPERRDRRKKEETITFDHLPNKSFRTAFILDRFSVNCTVSYCSNDLLLSTTSAIGRSFFDFVAKKDEDIVRTWIDVVKGWGVNERGQPSDGGFGFGKFSLFVDGRDSITRLPEPTTTRHRHGSTSTKGRSSRPNGTSARSNFTGTSSRTHVRTSPPTETNSPQILVDAIFSAHSDGLMVILRRASSS